MSRGTTVTNLLVMLKSEVGQQTTNTANDTIYTTLLSNKQKWLADEYDWPFLTYRWTVTANVGTRYTMLPTTDDFGGTTTINTERVQLVEAFWNNAWHRLSYGIGSQEYNYLNSDTNNPQRPQQVQDPIMRWRWSQSNQFETWPVNASVQLIRFTAQRTLSALSSGSDTCDLDDYMIVLFVAAELMIRANHRDAQIKLAQAQERLRAIRAVYPCRQEKHILGSYDMENEVRIVPIVRVAVA